MDGPKRLREAIYQLERKLRMLGNLQTACCGSTLAQCHAIMAMGRLGSSSLNDLADVLGLEKSTMSRTINNLVDDGLAVRDLDAEDRRYVRIELTESGRKIYDGIDETLKLYFRKVYGSLPVDKREQVMESLGFLLNAISEHQCCN